jgi:methionyl-tRNA synthetase
MTTPRHILVAVAWPYASGSLHLGHLGRRVPAARHLRPLPPAGRQSRPDGLRLRHPRHADHGEGGAGRGLPGGDRRPLPPRDPRLLGSLGISFDLFTTTDTPNHHRVAQEFFLRLLENGYLYRKTEMQFYDEQRGQFLPDRYVEGTCPHCGYNPARGDQCDNCGKILDPQDLIDPCRSCRAACRSSARPSTTTGS